PPLRSDPLHAGKLLSRAFLDVLVPFLGGGKQRPIPGRVREPKERSAILVDEITIVVRNANRPMLRETRLLQVGRARERAALAVEGFIRFVGAGGLVAPFAGFVRREANAPRLFAVPEPIHLARLARWRREGRVQLRLLHWIGVTVRAFQRDLEPRPLCHLLVCRQHWHAAKQQDGKHPLPPSTTNVVHMCSNSSYAAKSDNKSPILSNLAAFDLKLRIVPTCTCLRFPPG